MNIATGILGLILSMFILLQSCAAGVGGSIGDNKALSEDSVIGSLIALLFLVGGSFAFKLPKAAMVVFLLASVAGFLLAQGAYADLKIWAGVALILAVMSFFSGRKRQTSSS